MAQSRHSYSGLSGDSAPARAARPAALAWWPALCRLLDGLGLLLGGAAWVVFAGAREAFGPLAASLLALLLAGTGVTLLHRLWPPTPARRADLPGALAEALILPLALGGAAALLARALAGDAAGHTLLAWPLLAALGLLPARWLTAVLAWRGLRGGALRTRLAVVGATDVAERLLLGLSRLPERERPLLLGLYDDRNPKRRPAALGGVPVLGPVRALAARAAGERVDRIVIALPARRAPAILRALEEVQGLSSEIVLALAEEAAAGLPPAAPAGTGPVLRLIHPAAGAGESVAKAALDRALAALLLLLTAPLLALAALALRLEGPGPVLLREERLGRFGRPFALLRLRTLPSVAKGGPAPTPSLLGRLLRAVWIDELPRLLSVLSGEVSLVGPQPHPPGLTVAGTPIARLAPGYHGRLRVKPGLTGQAQLHGLHGPILSRGMAREVVAQDLAYIAQWSFWLDLRLLARAMRPPATSGGRGPKGRLPER